MRFQTDDVRLWSSKPGGAKAHECGGCAESDGGGTLKFELFNCFENE